MEPAGAGGEDFGIGGIGMENRRTSYSYEDLLACGRGELFNEGPQLPLPPMLMFDRITAIEERGGEHGKGQVVAELDVHKDLWFFSCHRSRCIRRGWSVSGARHTGERSILADCTSFRLWSVIVSSHRCYETRSMSSSIIGTTPLPSCSKRWLAPHSDDSMQAA